MHQILWDVCAFTLPPFSESLAETKRTKLKNPIKCNSSEARSVLLRVRICSDMLIDSLLPWQVFLLSHCSICSRRTREP